MCTHTHTQEGTQVPLGKPEGIGISCGCSCRWLWVTVQSGFWELNSDTLEEQQVLCTPEVSLQLPASNNLNMLQIQMPPCQCYLYRKYLNWWYGKKYITASSLRQTSFSLWSSTLRVRHCWISESIYLCIKVQLFKIREAYANIALADSCLQTSSRTSLLLYPLPLRAPGSGQNQGEF